MVIKIGHTDLKAVVEKKKGFQGLNPGKPGCTAPWSRLQAIGLSSEELTDAGKVVLAIGQGSVRNEKVTKYYKSIFKTEVLTPIKNFAPECGETFQIKLHYRSGLLSETEIEYK